MERTGHPLLSARTFLLALILSLSALGIGCGKKLSFLSLSESALSDYFVVSNANTKDIALFDPNGNYVRQLFRLPAGSSESIYGLHQFGNYLYFVVDGVDRVLRVDLTEPDAPAENYISDTALSGNLRGLTGNSLGELLIVESNNVEKFDSNRIRVTSGWPKALQTTGTGIAMMDDGGFVQCSTGTDVVRAYTSAGVQTATASSGIGGTTDVVDCSYSPETGRVLALFSGTTDTLRVYDSSSLATVDFNFSNTAILGTPKAAAFTTDGSVLAADGTSQRVYKIDAQGNFAGPITSVGIDNPNDLVVLR
ncbi:MAG: hypothetical protein JST04_17790 [Bdellovibrionales bacterium]|nr:hypothetical protein [Bdellovibrionales bacterium]